MRPHLRGAARGLWAQTPPPAPPRPRGPPGSPAQLCEPQVGGLRRRLLARSQNKQPKATSFPGGQLSQQRPAPVVAGSGLLGQDNPTLLTSQRRAGSRTRGGGRAQFRTRPWKGARVGGSVAVPAQKSRARRPRRPPRSHTCFTYPWESSADYFIKARIGEPQPQRCIRCFIPLI